MNRMDSATATAGSGLKPEHFPEAAADTRPGLWFEVHPENYMVAGGPRLAWLEAMRSRHPLSLHGVGLSLAGMAPPDEAHLARLKALADRFDPFLISEHLAWCVHAGSYAPDLLPFPRTLAALDRIAGHIDRVQTVLKRPILIENPSLYMHLRGHEMSETDMLTALCTRTGCGLLIDVNNVHVSASNLGFDARQWLDAIPTAMIGEIHLAGHAADAQRPLLIDTHGASVAEAVWSLYDHLVARIGPRPTLIERDDDIPPYAELMAERDRAHNVLTREPCHA